MTRRLSWIALAWLLVLAPFRSASAQAEGWLWIEGEDFARTNLPRILKKSEQRYCAACSQQQKLVFRVQPGEAAVGDHWTLEYALHPPAPTSYAAVWVAWNNPPAFEWTVDDQPWLPGRVADSLPYTNGQNLAWERLDPGPIDLALDPASGPHTLRFRFDPNQALNGTAIDALVFASDSAWRPNDVQRPLGDTSYLTAYQDMVPFVPSLMQPILTDTLPDAAQLQESVEVFASPGEYEPATVALHALRDLQSIDVHVGALQTESGSSLPAEAVDVRLVQVRPRLLQTRSAPNEITERPDILGYNTPFDLPSGQTQQVWLILHVPAGAEPGTYRAPITFAPANAPAQTVDLELQVLPINLLWPDNKAWGMDYRYKDEFNGLPKPDDPAHYIRQDMADLRAHGVHAIAYHTPIEVALDGQTLAVDYTAFETGLDLVVSEGMTESLAYAALKPLQRDLENLGLSGADMEAAYRQVVAGIVQRQESHGWPRLLLGPVDEPFRNNNPQRLESFLYQAGLIQQVPGAEVMITMPPLQITPQIVDLVAVRAYNGWGTEEALLTLTFDEIAAEAQAAGDTLWVYFNTRAAGNAFEFSRATQGLYFWNSPFRAQHVWSYQFFRGDAFDDLDGPDMAYAYPDPERDFAPTLTTLRWEGYREGVDDVRYLYTLEQAVASGTDPALVAEAERFLESVRARLGSVGPQARAIVAYLGPEDYRDIRWQAAQYIVALQDGGPSRPAPSPTPPPPARATQAPAASPSAEPTAAVAAVTPTPPPVTATSQPTAEPPASSATGGGSRSCLPSLGLFALPGLAAAWWVRRRDGAGVPPPGRPGDDPRSPGLPESRR